MFLDYGYLIYNPRLDKAGKPQITTQVKLFRDGKLVFTGSEIPFESSGQTDLKRLPAIGTIQLGTDLPAGEYIFQVIVTDALADEKHRVSSQWMDFGIIK